MTKAIFRGFLKEGTVLEKKRMFCKFQPMRFLNWILCGIVILGFSGGCRNPEQFKAEADQEVYQIIDAKWQDDFGEKNNYLISDVNDPISIIELSSPNEPASTNDVEIAEMIPESGVLNLQQAVEIATKFNRDYQSRKESLYLSALSLTLTRHQYARQWFQTIDGTYLD
ncbi:MAG: hypothetical protein ACYS17_01415, partial [Planctomycetota bacterium]